MSISIALCTYNGGKFLAEQLDSIAQQSLLPYELVVCDDRSSDGTLEILETFKEKAKFPVLIHRNENNLGSTKNFEKAIHHCSGEIIFLSDQDDIWKPQKIERLSQALRDNPDAGYVFSDAELVDENLTPLDLKLWETIGFFTDIRENFSGPNQFKILFQKKIVTGATMAIRKDICERAVPFPTKFNWIHDGWLALVSTATGARGIPIPETLIQYRQHDSQQIGTAQQPAERINKSLPRMYRDLKAQQKYLFADWEMRGQRVMELKVALEKLRLNNSSVEFEKNLNLLTDFERHFKARHKILTLKHPKRYDLVLREALSGRYAEFSNSWRTIFRDLFL